MRLFDSHAHIQGSEYAGDLGEVIARAREAGVERVMVPSDDVAMARAGIALAGRNEGLYASAGIHPHHASSVDDGVLRGLESLLSQDKVVALGEVGLDYFYMHSPREAQIAAFEAQLEMASRVGLPVIVHTRDAWEDTAAILDSWVRTPIPQPLSPLAEKGEPSALGGASDETESQGTSSSHGTAAVERGPQALTLALSQGEREPSCLGVPSLPVGVMHYFTGSLEDGLRFVEMGFLLSIHTSVTFKNAGAQREIVARLPLSSLVIETDSPFGAPQGYRGKRNEPAYVIEVAKVIAELQGVSLEDVAEATYANACRLFRLPVDGHSLRAEAHS